MTYFGEGEGVGVVASVSFQFFQWGEEEGEPWVEGGEEEASQVVVEVGVVLRGEGVEVEGCFLQLRGVGEEEESCLLSQIVVQASPWHY